MDPTTVFQLLSQIRDLQNKANSLSEEKDFHDPETPSSPGASHVRTQSLAIPSTRSIHRRDSGLPPNTRNSTGADVFEGLPAREGQPSALLEHSRNLASSSHGLRPEATGVNTTSEREMKREPQNSSTPVPCFQRGAGVFDHTCGTYSHNGVVDYPRFPIWEMHLGKFPYSVEFRSWKVNFRTEVCSKTGDTHLTMQWLKEVETANSIDELVKSRSIVERTDFTNYDMLDAMIASALKKLPTTSKCRRATRSKVQPILTRETDCMI